MSSRKALAVLVGIIAVGLSVVSFRLPADSWARPLIIVGSGIVAGIFIGRAFSQKNS